MTTTTLAGKWLVIANTPQEAQELVDTFKEASVQVVTRPDGEKKTFSVNGSESNVRELVGTSAVVWSNHKALD